jgi:lysophospholipase L1-like esterase
MPQQTTPTSKKSSGQQIWGRLLLVLLSVGITFFALEILVRFLPPPYGPDTGPIFSCDHSLGWIGAPNFDGVLEDVNFQQKLVFNSLGMHDTEHALEKPSHTFRILMLGDSFVHAVQVSEETSAHQVLENGLNEQKQTGSFSFEIISGGVVNWGTNQQLIYYREQGRCFQPDLVLLMFYLGNDFSDNLPGNVLTIKGFNCYAPYFALCEGKLNPDPLIYAPGISSLQDNCSPARRILVNSLGWLYQHSRLYQQIEPLLITNRPRREFGQAYPQAFSALYLPNDEAELEQAWQVTLATMTQLQQEVEADGSQLAVALISPEIIIHLGLLSPAEQEVFLKDNPDFAKAQVDRPNRRLAEFLNRQKIPFVDLTTPMIEHLAANSIPLYLLGEGHWTVEGNRVAADVLVQWLIQNDFFQGPE